MNRHAIAQLSGVGVMICAVFFFSFTGDDELPANATGLWITGSLGLLCALTWLLLAIRYGDTEEWGPGSSSVEQIARRLKREQRLGTGAEPSQPARVTRAERAHVSPEQLSSPLPTRRTERTNELLAELEAQDRLMAQMTDVVSDFVPDAGAVAADLYQQLAKRASQIVVLDQSIGEARRLDLSATLRTLDDLEGELRAGVEAHRGLVRDVAVVYAEAMDAGHVTPIDRDQVVQTQERLQAIASGLRETNRITT